MNEAQVRALREGAGALRLERGRLVVRGADRVSWLHNLTTQDIKRLAPGREGCFATMVTRIGKLVATLQARVLADEIRIDTDRPRELREAMEKLIIIEDVQLEEVTAKTSLVGVYGPMARERLGLPDLPPWGIHGDALRVPVYGVDGYELWLPAGAKPNVDATSVSPEALDVLRIEACHPKWGAELDETIIPVEANLESIAVSYSKGCYIGQEIIQRIKTYSQAKQQLRRLRLKGEPLPSAGEKILREGAVVGRVTSAVRSLHLGPIALGFVGRDHAAEGTRVVAGSVEAVIG
ncbi:MAG TPA: glycine cleavage T C-terminal barrel domain-containing protein [Planctomycetota bacterium]|nr:glycine cleavage T C-terminal barrel domain-containing protein [Planctomycetota bacterium]